MELQKRDEPGFFHRQRDSCRVRLADDRIRVFGDSGESASKAAAAGFSRSLAGEAGRIGITVNAIATGFVDIELTEPLETKAPARRGAVPNPRSRGARPRHDTLLVA